MLNKKDLIAKYAKISGKSKAESETIINDMITAFEEAVINDGGIQLTGVVTIGVKTVKAKTVINPSTKKPMQTKESLSLSIRTGKTLKEKLNA